MERKECICTNNTIELLWQTLSLTDREWLRTEPWTKRGKREHDTAVQEKISTLKNLMHEHERTGCPIPDTGLWEDAKKILRKINTRDDLLKDWSMTLRATSGILENIQMVQQQQSLCRL